jgi:hypothetical protein
MNGSDIMAIMNKTRILALGVALAIGATGGCHHSHSDRWDLSERGSDDDDSQCDLVMAGILLGAIALVAIPMAIAESAAQSDAPAPPRALPTVRGHLVDGEGRPIAGATLMVRAAKRYTATPEKLPAVTMQTGADGSFVLPMARANALCVDFSAEGKRPERRWFVLLVPAGLKGLPEDQRQITFLSPYAKEEPLARMTLDTTER